ncbi:hypothetical protein K8I28_17065, partial [bacterium]|nr:hypothetical protein [bacterium]
IVLVVGACLIEDTSENLFDITINFQVNRRVAIRSMKQVAEAFPPSEINHRFKAWKSYLKSVIPEKNADFVIKDFRLVKGVKILTDS